MGMDLPPPRLPSGPYIMGIVNVTPDSFSDGGQYVRPSAALDHACRLWEAGADLIDIGGESTRPGAQPVAADEEIDRTAALIEALAGRIPAWISIDTMKPAVARAAAKAGARLWNDVGALQAPGAAQTAAALGLQVILMHKQGQPSSMQHAPRYHDVIEEVIAFLEDRIAAALAGGLGPDALWIDPGIGFGKTLAHNGELLRAIGTLRARLARPICIGLSRKSFIGALEAGAGHAPSEPSARLGGSIAGAVMATLAGAQMLRVHDVAPTIQALRVMQMFEGKARAP